VKRSNAQDLMLCYNVPFFNGGDVEGFLTSLARAGGRVRKVCSTAPRPDASYTARRLVILLILT